MIKAIILDVDGVIIGEKKGFNFPQPHPKVLARLKAIKARGIPISLCTAKPHYAIKKIIDDAGLNNIHITMAGGIMIDPIDNVILDKHPINGISAKKVVNAYLQNNAYTEFYTVDNYYVQASQAGDLTTRHTEILQKEPILVGSLADETSRQEIVKIMPIARDENDRERLAKIFEPFENKLVLSWGVHPFAAPHKFGNITAKGISKRQATTELARSLNIDPEEILGIGDSVADWQFIELCGYAGAMGNASDELKQLISKKGQNSFIGDSVDENGVLSILEHFKL